MIDLDEIEARANAATPGPWKYCAESDAIKGTNALIVRGARSNSGPFIASARTDVPALVARVRELEAECERLRTFAAENFSAMVRQEAEQMRAYGLSYEGVRKVLREHDDGEISFGKLMDLIRAAARAMAKDATHVHPSSLTDVVTLLEEDRAELRAMLADAHRELATIEAITVSPSGVDGLIGLVNRIGHKLEASK